jgi:hypothetical protein
MEGRAVGDSGDVLADLVRMVIVVLELATRFLPGGANIQRVWLESIAWACSFGTLRVMSAGQLAEGEFGDSSANTLTVSLTVERGAAH